MADIKALGDQLVELSVKEVNELASYLKETHGIEPAAAVAIAVWNPICVRVLEWQWVMQMRMPIPV